MSLLNRIVAILREAKVPHALIGALAMARHGIVRSTIDQDLLVVNLSCLQSAFWKDLQGSDVQIEIRKGDAFDPLAGVVRMERAGERPLDVVVGKFAWQREVLRRSIALQSAPDSIPVVRMADLILLKLYAGGPQDAWDIEQILATEDRESLISEVDEEISQLPAESALLWRKILNG